MKDILENADYLIERKQMRSKDGLMTSTNAHHILSYNQICEDYENSRALWISELKANGYKAAHPDDGWVNRENNTVQFAYPHFNLFPQVGDKIMLGWHSEPNNRTVEITSVQEVGICSKRTEYKFKDSDEIEF